MKIKLFISLIVISFLFIFLAPSFANAAPILTIKDVSDSPDPFSPNKDGIEDETTISATISASGFKARRPLKLTWKLNIRDSEGKLVRKFSRHTKIKNDSQIEISQTWDGRDRKGKLVDNGTYAYTIDAKVKKIKAASVSGDVTVTGLFDPTLVINNVSDSPDPFSPNGDGVDDKTKLSATISISGFEKYFKKPKKLPLIWTLVIKDAQGEPVRSFSHTQKVKNNTEIEVTQIWNGKKSKKQLVTDGAYSYEFSARIHKIRAEAKFGEVTVVDSATPPKKSLVNIISPQDGAYLRSQIPVEVNYRGGVKILELYIDGELYEKAELSRPFKKGSYSFSLDTTQYTDGEHTLQAFGYLTKFGPKLKHKFKFGASQEIKVIIDNTPPQIIIGPVTSPTNIATQTIAGSYIEEYIDTIEINGISTTIDETTNTYSTEINLSEGTNTITVVAIDTAGNSGTATTEIILDTVLPQVIIDSVTTPTNIATQIITGAYIFEEAISTIEINGIPATIDDIAKTYSAEITLTEGENDINVIATDLAGNTASASTTIFLDTTPPAPPTGLVATLGDTIVDLNWSANAEPDVAGYNVYRSETSGGPYTKINTELITGTSYQDTTVVVGILYYYVITACDNAGNESSYSQEVTTVTVLSVSVSPDFWQIGAVNVNSITTISEVDKITVTNDGQTTATYSLCLVNPQGWTASQTEIGKDIYILNTAFSANKGNITWNETNHALSTVPVRATSSKFAGDQTGVSVVPNEKRVLWLQFKAPSATAVTGEQNIEAIINAQVP